MISCKKLLPVKAGELGLRQSDAVFHHTRQLPELITEAFAQAGEATLEGVGVSVRPRDQEGSYMPCFLTGALAARAAASGAGVPEYRFSHQAGHIGAALFSAGKTQWRELPFLAFHLSGGTTECLLVQPSDENIFEIQVVAQSLDLKAGQAVDRVGVMLGLGFPAGAELDELSQKAVGEYHPKPTMKGLDCCLSGLENQCAKLLQEQMLPEEIARYCFSFLGNTLEEMTVRVQQRYGRLPLLYAGGVMCNRQIKGQILSRFPDAVFAQPEYSSDNSAGIALLANWKAKG